MATSSSQPVTATMRCRTDQPATRSTIGARACLLTVKVSMPDRLAAGGLPAAMVRADGSGVGLA